MRQHQQAALDDADSRAGRARGSAALPRPGRANTNSTVTAPPRIQPMRRPRMVTTGSSAWRSTWRSWMRRARQALGVQQRARNPAAPTSIMATRVTRATSAMPPKPMVSDRQHQRVPAPRAGDRKPAELHGENSRIISRPARSSATVEPSRMTAHDAAGRASCLLRTAASAPATMPDDRREGEGQRAERSGCRAGSAAIRSATGRRSTMALPRSPVSDVAEPEQVLFDQRLVEAVFARSAMARVCSGDEPTRIRLSIGSPGTQMDDQEDHQRDRRGTPE